jgi:ATP-dependent Clp protease adaptor protein ClpS
MKSTVVVPERTANTAEASAFEPLYLVLVHDDDETPYDYVVLMLRRVFMLSEELADHVAFTAHNDGQAVVVIRPRDEALRLIAIAHNRARADGFPLNFTMQPEA